MILIDYETVVGQEYDAILILKDTGVFYTTQADGINCTHPKAEGFLIKIFIDDNCPDPHEYACYNFKYNDMITKLKFANEFDNYMIGYTDGWRYNIRFDFDRLDECMEAWIPIIVNGRIDPFEDFELVDAKAFLLTANCD